MGGEPSLGLQPGAGRAGCKCKPSGAIASCITKGLCISHPPKITASVAVVSADCLVARMCDRCGKVGGCLRYNGEERQISKGIGQIEFGDLAQTAYVGSRVYGHRASIV
jgi:hypothetical protein